MDSLAWDRHASGGKSHFFGGAQMAFAQWSTTGRSQAAFFRSVAGGGDYLLDSGPLVAALVREEPQFGQP